MFTVKNYVYDGPAPTRLGEWDRWIIWPEEYGASSGRTGPMWTVFSQTMRKVRIMFPQVVANAAAGNGGKTGKEGMRRPARRHGVCNAVLCAGGLPPSLGIEDVIPYYGTHQDDGLSAQC